MRFATRFDAWLVAVLVAAALLSCGLLPGMRFLGPTRSAPVWPAVLTWFIWAFAPAATLPQYYETRPAGLFIRQGWRKVLIPYANLVEVQPVTSALSAPVFSTHRILVTSKEGERLIIAVAEEDRFLSEIGRRAPQLERRSFGLGPPLAPPSLL